MGFSVLLTWFGFATVVKIGGLSALGRFRWFY